MGHTHAQYLVILLYNYVNSVEHLQFFIYTNTMKYHCIAVLEHLPGVTLMANKLTRIFTNKQKTEEKNQIDKDKSCNLITET